MSGPRRSGNTITEKLRECLPYIAQDMSNSQIATELGISVYAVNRRVERIMEIAGRSIRKDLIEYAKEEECDE